jgi:hypothetical protein
MVINNCELNPFYCSPFAKDGAKINKISGKNTINHVNNV